MTIHFAPLHIVAGGDIVGAECFGGKFKESFKLNFLVAHDVRVWRAAGFVFGEEILEHIVPVLGGEIDFVQLDTKCIADLLRIF